MDFNTKKSNSPSLWERLRYVFSLMTIEPMVMIQGIAQYIIEVPQSQMLLYKTCRDPRFNMTEEFCSNIEDHAEEGTIYDDIEEATVSFNQIYSWTENTVPILLAFYIGSLSDQYGRLPFLALCMMGKLTGSFFNLLNAIYLDSWSRWVWLGTVLPIQNITGGFLTFIMMTYSFIADNSTQRERMIRIGLCSFSWQVARPLSYPIGAWLFDSGGYVRVFSASLILYVVASIIGLISLWNFKENKEKHSTSLSELISPRHIVESFKVVFKKRKHNKRFYLISMMVMMLTHLVTLYAELYCQFMYTKRMFEWEVKDYSYFTMVQKFTTAAGIFVFSIFFHRLNLNDNIIIVLSGLSSISAQIFRALAGRNEDVFMASISVEVGSDLFSAPIRAQMTRCISPEETGKVFAMLASLECAVPIIASMIFTNVYNATSGLSYPWAGTFYFGAAGFTLIGLIIAVIVYIRLGGKMVPTDTENTGEQNKLESGK